MRMPGWRAPVSRRSANSPAWRRLPGVVDALFETKAVAAAESALSAICARQPDPTMCADQAAARPGQGAGRTETGVAACPGHGGRPEGAGRGARGGGRVGPVRQGNGAAGRCATGRPSMPWPTWRRSRRRTADPKFKLLALRGQLRLDPAADRGRRAEGVAAKADAAVRSSARRNSASRWPPWATCPARSRWRSIMPYLTGEGLKEEAERRGRGGCRKDRGQPPGRSRRGDEAGPDEQQATRRARPESAGASAGGRDRGGFHSHFQRQRLVRLGRQARVVEGRGRCVDRREHAGEAVQGMQLPHLARWPAGRLRVAGGFQAQRRRQLRHPDSAPRNSPTGTPPATRPT